MDGKKLHEAQSAWFSTDYVNVVNVKEEIMNSDFKQISKVGQSTWYPEKKSVIQKRDLGLYCKFNNPLEIIIETRK